jgi:regulatory protein
MHMSSTGRDPTPPRRRPSPSAIDAALRYLAQRPRSEAEVRQRLRRAGIAPDEIEQTLAQLKRHGLIDDRAFAAYWVEQRRTFRPRGARLLQAELRAHGVGALLAAGGAVSTDDDAYRAALKKARLLATLDERTFRARLGQFLARRGFDWDTIAPTVDRLWCEQGAGSSTG